MNDQTAKADAGKAPLSLVPRRIIFDIARIREYGNKKYHDPNNWKNVEVERYRDAAFRHLLAYLDDPSGVDEESGLPHYWHLACNVAFICEMEDAKRTSTSNSNTDCRNIKYFNKITFQTKECAAELLKEMRSVADSYGQVTLIDFYELCDVIPEFYNIELAWKTADLEDVDIINTENGWMIDLPEPKVCNY